MAHAKITLFGMYEYGKTTEEYDLFEGLSLPSVVPASEADILKQNILVRGGEFEVLYAEPYFLKNAIALWSSKWGTTIERWYKALHIEYNPLENYDRIEDWRDDTASAKSDKTNTERKETTTGTDISSQTSSGTNENQVSAFDQSTYQPAEKNINSGTASNQSNRISSSDASSTDDTTSSGMTNAVHSGRTHGNIGVTTSQQMLQQEIDIAKFNFIDEVTNLFLMELTLYTY